MQETAAPEQKPGKLAAALPWLTAIASTLILIVPVLDPRLQLYYRDTGRLYYPVKRYIADRLAHGELALWDPWTSAGLSLLGQISPGLLHPFTLLYALLPFDLAFKLNHLVSMPLGALGAYWLARKLRLDPWPAAFAGVAFGGCGYLVSMAASNLPYALGAGCMPLAAAGLLWMLERPSTLRLLVSALLLANCNYAGEPQSALFAAMVAGPCALGMAFHGAAGFRAGLRPAMRAIGGTAVWAAAGLMLSLPAVLPGGLRAHEMSRWKGLTAEERAIFSLHPARMLSLAIPFAFDDVNLPNTPERKSTSAYFEFFSIGDRASFADSIGLGMPAMLLALLAFFSDRRGRWLSLGGLVLLLGATGPSLGVNGILVKLVPGLGLFRYDEKLMGPASLLFALAAAVGAQVTLVEGGKRAKALGVLAAGSALLLWAARAWLAAHRDAAFDWVAGLGHEHVPAVANDLLDLLGSGLGASAALSAALALITIFRVATPRGPRFAPALGAACAIAAMLTYASDLLFVTDRGIYNMPRIARLLLEKGGPSQYRWRVFATAEARDGVANWSDVRIGGTQTELSILAPQYDALFGIEGTAPYFSLLDDPYAVSTGWRETRNFAKLYDVRFFVAGRSQMNPRQASTIEFKEMDNFWVRENPPRPRAFLVARAFAPPPEGSMAVMADPRFDVAVEAVIEPPLLHHLPRIDGPGPVGDASWKRISPEQIDVETSAPATRLLVISEHFDNGWRAAIDGSPSPVIYADLSALALPVPAGKHHVSLHFWPRGLTLALWIAALVLAALVGGSLWEARRRRQLLSAH